MCGVVEIWARGSRGWKREEAEETRKFCLTRSGSDLGFKRAVLFSGGGGGVKDAEEWRDRKSTRLNSSHNVASRMPSSA